MWRYHKEEVKEELKRMLNIDILDSLAPAYFQNRTAAAKIIYDKMDQAKKTNVLKLVKYYKEHGNTREFQEK